MPKKEITLLKSEIREFNKLVQQIIKDRILQNRETRQLKIKLKNDEKVPYTLDELRDMTTRNKYYLMFKQHGEKFVDIIKEDQAKSILKKQIKLARKQEMTNQKLDSIEIVPEKSESKQETKEETRQLLKDVRVRALYRKHKYPQMKWEIKGNYPGYDEFYKQWNNKFGQMIYAVKQTDKYKNARYDQQQEMLLNARGSFMERLEANLLD